MRVYTCCPHRGCNGFRDALRFLRDWGIEPEIKQDDDGHFFEFDIPDYWPQRRKRAFARALSGRTVGLPPIGGNLPADTREDQDGA